MENNQSVYPSLEVVEKYAKDNEYDIIPIAKEILSDTYTSIQVVKTLKEISSHVFLLESVENSKNWGRYSFLGYYPTRCISYSDGKLLVDDCKVDKEPFDYLRELLSNYKSVRLDDMPPFTGGLVGYFSYDFAGIAEPAMKVPVEDDEGFKDLDLMLFENIIAFDNYKQKILLITNVKIDSNYELNYFKAIKTLEEMEDILKKGNSGKEFEGKLLGEPKPIFDKDTFCNMVNKAKKYIKEGDIFQVVLSNRIFAPFKGSLLGAYRMLRTINPSPYMFYFSGTDVEVAGASPETLVTLRNKTVHTFHLAGTRRRGIDEAEDEQLEKELLADEKELAEHNMLVDLGRNDLGKISKFGSVKVEKLREVVKFSHVMHIGSTVKGEIADGYDAIDAINAVLPAGTLSGAPKIRASQIIGELENNKRGIYGGAVGYIDFTGNMDTCIAIRLAYKKNNKVFVRSGAGIVADSVPESEYQECINKASAVISALKEAQKYGV